MEIIIKLQGGLGNQMFQWAFGKAFEIKTGQKVYFDDYEYTTKHPFRNFELDKFNLNISIKHPVRKKQRIRKILRELIPTKALKDKINIDPILVVQNHIIEKTYFSYEENLFNITPPAYIEGFFQNLNYFSAIEDEIRNDFKLKLPLNDENTKTLEKIKNSESISVHIRRSDYLSSANSFECCPIEYYKKALEELVLKKNVKNPVLFIFSDDHDWVKENVTFNYETNYVNFNDWNGAVFDLELMKNCKHNIIANSTFSWWGAWLNENPDKMVISPKPWLINSAFDPSADPWFRINTLLLTKN